MSAEWLRWNNIHLVINCLGRINAYNEEDVNWRTAVDAQVEGINYIPWCINFRDDRQKHLWPFDTMKAVLKRGEGVYVHCKSGKDRSAITVYALPHPFVPRFGMFNVFHALPSKRESS